MSVCALMYASYTAAMHMRKAGCSGALEMMPLITVPVMRRIAVPEKPIIAPVAIVERAVVAIIVTIVVAGSRSHPNTRSLTAGAACGGY